MAYDDVEQSIQDAAPAELYEFVAPVQTWRMTSYIRDIVYLGNTYTAVTKSRSAISIGDATGAPDDMTIQLPATHALAQKYANGTPMREIAVKVRRFHLASGVALQIWEGFVTSIAFEGRMATFRVPNGTVYALANPIPSVQCQRLCNHVLYDEQCRVPRAPNEHTTTITVIFPNEKKFYLVDIGAFGLWDHIHGEMLHVASDERRTIANQSGATIDIQYPFPADTVQIGDTVKIYRGCDHRFSTCRTKFANTINFGGHPHLPDSNLFKVGLQNARYEAPSED